MATDAMKHRPFLNRQFIGVTVIAVAAILAYLPFSPAAVQKREMATMQLFFDQLAAEWAASGRAGAAALKGAVNTSVFLDVHFEQPVDNNTWADLIARIKAKRDAYRHVSRIRVSTYASADTVGRERFENVDPK